MRVLPLLCFALLLAACMGALVKNKHQRKTAQPDGKRKILKNAPIQFPSYPNSDMLRVRHKAHRKAGLAEICYEDCDLWECTIYECPGGVCCTPGSPNSRCCPESHPECMENEGVCCPRGLTKICGLYCCNPQLKCCGSGAGTHCCLNENTCCGSDSCCTDSAPCCGNNECCDPDLKTCCGDSVGCQEPCESQFDAVNCETLARTLREKRAAASVTSHQKPHAVSDAQSVLGMSCPAWDRTTMPLYRILRPEESCTAGLLAKDTSASKSVESHVGCGSRRGYTSQYISTTTVLDVAIEYNKRFQAQNNGQNATIAIIQPTNVPVGCAVTDLTNPTIRNELLRHPMNRNFAAASCEVLLSCGSSRVSCAPV